MLLQCSCPVRVLGFLEPLADEGKLSREVLDLSLDAVLVAVSQLRHFGFHSLDLAIKSYDTLKRYDIILYI